MAANCSLGGSGVKERLIAAVFALGIAVGCSQTDGATATPLPNLVVPTPEATVAATNPDPQLVPTRSRQRRPAGRGFVPLDDPVFLAADEADYLGDEELVLGVEWADEVRAYPVRMLRYHHVINDSVGGSPLLVTY